MVELSTPVKSWKFLRKQKLQSKGCRFNSCPFHFFNYFFVVTLFLLNYFFLPNAFDFHYSK